MFSFSFFYKAAVLWREHIMAIQYWKPCKSHLRKELFTAAFQGLPWWLRWSSVCLQCGRLGFDPWVGKIPWRRKQQPTPVLLPGKFQGQRSLVGYSPWGHKESKPTERLHSLTHSFQGSIRWSDFLAFCPAQNYKSQRLSFVNTALKYNHTKILLFNSLCFLKSSLLTSTLRNSHFS